MIILLSATVVLILAFILCIKPNNRRRGEMQEFQRVLIAHRGLHSGKYPENSMAAFEQAINKNLGIELDVRLTKDGQIVVFHDENLHRMCAVDKNVFEHTYRELVAFDLRDSNEKIPLFADVLALVDRRVPLIIELKDDKDNLLLCEKVAQLLDHYKGTYCIESFNPSIVAWFKKYRPQIVRGQLSTNYFSDHKQMNFLKKFFLTNMLSNFYTTPDFIAYNHKFSEILPLIICRKIYHGSLVAWTIKDEEMLRQAKNRYDVFIFDSFLPKELDET